MLQIDDDAVDALTQIGSLRISAEETDEGVELQIDEATEPQEGDEVVEREGGRVREPGAVVRDREHELAVPARELDLDPLAAVLERVLQELSEHERERGR